jgi:hypothetical protein
METTGTCKICNTKITQKDRNKHFISCAKKYYKLSDENNSYILSIEGKYNPEYWLNIIFAKDWSLKKIDSFLRDVWLECCGHLSSFDINGIDYSNNPDKESDEKGMNYKIKDLVDVKDKFKHIYDYGTPTELVIKVISEIKYDKNLKHPEIIGQNEIPDLKCDLCNNLATHICCECSYDDKGWLCDECSENHECGEEMLSPVVNSPRVGVCGYCG